MLKIINSKEVVYLHRAMSNNYYFSFIENNNRGDSPQTGCCSSKDDVSILGMAWIYVLYFAYNLV